MYKGRVLRTTCAQIFTILLVLVQIGTTSAQAACPNPNETGGSSAEGVVVYNSDYNVVQVCGGTTWYALGEIKPGAGDGTCSDPEGVEGEMLYNQVHSVPQFCNGEEWIAMGYFPAQSSGGCSPPMDCSTVGNVCSDGSIFAGFMVYDNSSCEPLYVTDNNQSTSTQWKTATGTNDITDPDNHVDGQYNRDNRGGGTFPAFELCENNTYHGKNDWYLPARAELNLLWMNRAAIDANAAGNFTANYYWSSTEYNTTNPWYQHFSDGSQSGLSYSKSYSIHDVRCVRRD